MQKIENENAPDCTENLEMKEFLAPTAFCEAISTWLFSNKDATLESTLAYARSAYWRIIINGVTVMMQESLPADELLEVTRAILGRHRYLMSVTEREMQITNDIAEGTRVRSRYNGNLIESKVLRHGS